MGGYQKNKPILAKETEENKEINRTEGMEQNSYHNEEEESIIAIAKHTMATSSLIYIHTNTYV